MLNRKFKPRFMSVFNIIELTRRRDANICRIFNVRKRFRQNACES